MSPPGGRFGDGVSGERRVDWRCRFRPQVRTVISITGLSFEPHGYVMIFEILLAAVLTPVALI